MERIKGFSIDEVESRMAEIRSIDLDTYDNIEELEKEVDALESRKNELKAKAETKAELRNKILKGEVKTNKVEKPMEERTMEFTKENFMSTKEYRDGFFKQLLGREVNTEERAALAMSGAAAVIPTETQNSIMELAKEFAPVLNDVTLLHVNGGVKFAVEGVNDAAKEHTEGATLTPDTVNLVFVELSTHEVVKQVMISSAVKSMTIPAFESWLTDCRFRHTAVDPAYDRKAAIPSPSAHTTPYGEPRTDNPHGLFPCGWAAPPLSALHPHRTAPRIHGPFCQFPV